MNLTNRSYMLDAESIELLDNYAKNEKLSRSAALRRIITAFLKVKNHGERV